ncbi:MAG: hypothetical protein ABI311_05120 [Gemmatimonadaceae bacterium]
MREGSCFQCRLDPAPGFRRQRYLERLLVPRGFDPATEQFSYSVNPRFADTRTTNTLTQNPFRISIDFSINLSVDQTMQRDLITELKRMLAVPEADREYAGFHFENSVTRPKPAPPASKP